MWSRARPRHPAELSRRLGLSASRSLGCIDGDPRWHRRAPSTGARPRRASAARTQRGWWPGAVWHAGADGIPIREAGPMISLGRLRVSCLRVGRPARALAAREADEIAAQLVEPT